MSAAFADWIVEPLGKKHDRADFSCGQPSLDTYIKTIAGQDARRYGAAPFVVRTEGSYVVLGYYTLSALTVELTDVPAELASKLPRYPLLPATLIGRLAVAEAAQGRGLGEYLLMDALSRALRATHQVASCAVVVDPIDERAAAFYGRYDFAPLMRADRRLFLPMNVVAKIFP